MSLALVAFVVGDTESGEESVHDPEKPLITDFEE